MRTRDFAGVIRAALSGTLLIVAVSAIGQRKVSVPTVPPSDVAGLQFRDGRYGVRFEVPPGWNFTRKDREVSTFRLDARTAPEKSELRGVASLGFNPFPRSVLSGALVYFSVAKHATDRSCAAQTISFPNQQDEDLKLGRRSEQLGAMQGVASIGGMPFAHGHDERGGMCVEQRDEVYTAYRKGSCYRFDLAVNTFCAVSSGAAELSREQMQSLEARMAGILSSVALDWEKSGPQLVPVPEIAPSPETTPEPRRPAGRKPAVGMGA